MKGKRIIAGILLVGILATTLAGCKNDSSSKKETEKPVITLGSDSYPPYNYLNEDGVPTGIDVELATEAFKRMGYQVEVVQIDWEEKKELVESGEIDCIMGCFSMEGRLDDYRWAGASWLSCAHYIIKPLLSIILIIRLLLYTNSRKLLACICASRSAAHELFPAAVTTANASHTIISPSIRPAAIPPNLSA